MSAREKVIAIMNMIGVDSDYMSDTVFFDDQRCENILINLEISWDDLTDF